MPRSVLLSCPTRPSSPATITMSLLQDVLRSHGRDTFDKQPPSTNFPRRSQPNVDKEDSDDELVNVVRSIQIPSSLFDGLTDHSIAFTGFPTWHARSIATSIPSAITDTKGIDAATRPWASSSRCIAQGIDRSTQGPAHRCIAEDI